LFIWIFVPIFTMMAVSFFFPQTQPFRVIYVLPAIIFLFSSAASRYPKIFMTFFLYIFIFGNLLYFTRPRLQREQWRQAISFLRDQNAPVLVKFPDKFSPFYWYAPDLPVTSAKPPYSAPKLFLLQYLTDLTDPKRQIDQSLRDSGYTTNRTYDFAGVGFIEEYQKKP
ncbi:hypothetical protein HYS82_01435, partial [Candidatus Amesbacteria bacterium]|nr:hypothetical protein [Candidatus Amesbacteria bacterium]